MPATSFGASNYWVDPVFVAGDVPPAVISTAPADDVSEVELTATVSATFSVPIVAGTAQLRVTGPSSAPVSGSVTTNGAGTVVTFTPSAPLVAGATYTATVSEARSTAGLTMSAPVSWNFSTVPPATCPCTLFGTTAPSAPDSGDGSSVEVGVRFTPSVAGYVSGVKFFKSAANTGTHRGTLWSAAGTALASGTFTGESATGWQTLVFSSPVPVQAGTTYTASYLAPRGHYAATANFFTGAHSRGPLVAPATTNGVYAYGSGNVAPTNVFAATNYWVDVVFNTVATTEPQVTETTPVDGATTVGLTAAPTATFAAAINPATVAATLTPDSGPAVAVTTSYDATNRRVTIDHLAALAPSTTYTVSVTAEDPAGNPMSAAMTWQFTTTAGSQACPCTLFGTAEPVNPDTGDTSSIELGVRFTPGVDGVVTGVKFFKSEGNVGTHTGTLWSPTGVALATGSFTAESATGWQTLTFGSPVPVEAGRTYTASYLAPSGHYAATANFFSDRHVSGPLVAPATNNGVYAYGSGNIRPTESFAATNYWVDVVFAAAGSPPSSPPPVLTASPSTAVP
jgi:hypothetical protein